MSVRAETDIRPVGVIDGAFYGTDIATNNELHKSEDNGETWSLVNDMGSGSAIFGIEKLSDGEVLVNRRANGLYKSSGWAADPTTATWTQVLVPSTDAWLLPDLVDVNGSVVLVGEYANPRDPSRYLWVSTDDGDNFSQVLDLNALYGAENADTVHWHSVCIDPWTDVMWASHGDGTKGLYYSEDNGSNWTLLSSTYQPTTLTAAEFGIVMGTDEEPEGLMRMIRKDTPGDMVVEQALSLGYTGWYGFAQRGYRDPDTDLVYVAMQADTDGLPAHILVSDGINGKIAYTSSIGTQPDCEQALTYGGYWVGDLNVGGTRYLLRGKVQQSSW